MSEQRERTLIIIKSVGVERGLVGTTIERFEKKGFKLVGLKFVRPTEELLEQHYSGLWSRPFYPTLVKYMGSGPVVPIVWEGVEAVKSARQILGITSPAAAVADSGAMLTPGTIRGDYDAAGNIIHCSDGMDAARKEIALWFTEEEVVGWTLANENWIDKSNE